MEANAISDEKLDQLGEAYVRRLRQGEQPPFDEFTAGFPSEQAAEIEEFLDSVKLLEELKDSSESAVEDPPEMPREFGRYHIGRTLGAGGMGAVYLAVDSQLERQVALKTPRFSRTSTRGFVERFYREAKSAATLRHPNICPVYDVGQIDGIHYISMAYIQGQSLADMLREEGAIEPYAAVTIARKVAGALQEAHSLGVIHRDLKPANIMIDNRGEPVVTDFGLAGQVGVLSTGEPQELPGNAPTGGDDTAGQQGRLTLAGTVLGSPGYMAPEQIHGEADKTGAATDIYALGVVLYEMLTGILPSHEPDDMAPETASRDRGIPRTLLAVCQQSMAADPQDRFGSMDDFAEALSACQYQTSLRSGKPRASSSWLTWSAAVVGLTLVLIVAGFFLLPIFAGHRPRFSPGEDPSKAFLEFDTNNDGAVSEAELSTADTRMHPADSPLRRAVERFGHFDNNPRDGKLDEHELRRVMHPPPRWRRHLPPRHRSDR